MISLKTHHYFLLEESPWPILCSLCSFNLLFSLLLFFKYSLIMSFLSSLTAVILGSSFWWSIYVGEFCFLGMNTTDLDSGLKMGMILFISSEVFFFFSFFWGYFHFFLNPLIEIGSVWPPQGVTPFDIENVPMLNTLILLSSGVTVTLSHDYLVKNLSLKCNIYLLGTVLLGAGFTFFQYKEYQSSFFSLSDGGYGSSFFILTGFHGIHVLIGSIFLLTVLYLGFSLNSPSKMNFLSFELSSWYWHFVDVVWAFLFFVLYYLHS